MLPLLSTTCAIGMNGSRRNTNKQTKQKTLALTLSVGGPQPLAASATRRGPGDREEGGWRMLGLTGGGTDGRSPRRPSRRAAPPESLVGSHVVSATAVLGHPVSLLARASSLSHNPTLAG